MVRLLALLMSLTAAPAALAAPKCDLPEVGKIRVSQNFVTLGSERYPVRNGAWRKVDRMLLACDMGVASKKLRGWRTSKQVTAATIGVSVPLALFPPTLIVTLPASVVASAVTPSMRNGFEDELELAMRRRRAREERQAPAVQRDPAPKKEPKAKPTDRDVAMARLQQIEGSRVRILDLRAQAPTLAPPEGVSGLLMEADLLRRELEEVDADRVELNRAIAGDLTDVYRTMATVERSMQQAITDEHDRVVRRERMVAQRARSSQTGNHLLLSGAGMLVLGGVSAAMITAPDPYYAGPWVPTIGAGLLGAGLVGAGLMNHREAGRTHHDLLVMDSSSATTTHE